MGDVALWGAFGVLLGKDQEAESFFAATGKHGVFLRCCSCSLLR